MEQEMVATWAQVGIGVGQLVMIGFGLWQMSQGGKRRDRQLDIMEAAQRRQGDALERQGEVLAELLRRPTA